jgi:spore coat protein CotH
LSLKSNYEDRSFLREKVSGEIFYEAGIVSANTSFCEVYVDHGDGSQYFGLYTIVEEMDDTVIKNQFSVSSGNLYKPEGEGASFQKGSFNKDHFTKDTNEDDADWSEIENLFSVLHSELRTTDPITWEKELDAILDTENFLKYLAYNTVLQNWDTYGRMTHNYFLYNDPESNKLIWIPWDNNEALQIGKQEGALKLNFSNLSKNGQWPLIEYLYANEHYRSIYDAFVGQSINDAFNQERLIAKYNTYSQLIHDSVTKEETGYTFLNSIGDFQSGVSDLINHASQRTAAVNNYK